MPKSQQLNRHASSTRGGKLAVSSATAGLQDLARLRRALRKERNLGRSGHWSYDLNRHKALLCAYRGAVAAVQRGDATSRETLTAFAREKSGTGGGLSRRT